MGFFDVILKGLGFEVEDKPKKEKKEKLNKNKKIGEFDLQQIQNYNNQNNDLLLENNDLKNEQENNELFKNIANEEGKYLDKNLIIHTKPYFIICLYRQTIIFICFIFNYYIILIFLLSLLIKQNHQKFLLIIFNNILNYYKKLL